MTDPSRTPEIDDLAATLRQHAPRLDDVSRARIAQALATLPAPRSATEEPSAARVPSWRWPAGVAAALAVAAVALLWAHRATPTGAPPRDVTARLTPAAEATLPAMPAELARRTLRAGLVEVVAFGDAKAELLSTDRGLELAIDEGTVHVLGTGDAPLVMRSGSLLVTASRASFAASVDERGVRVQVVRGELLIRHQGALATRTLAAPAEVLLPWPEGRPPQQARTATLPSPPPTKAQQVAGARAPAQAAAIDKATSAAAPSEALTGAATGAASDAAVVREPDAIPGAALEALYRAAEDAMRRGDAAAGRLALEELVRRAPRDRRADTARFDLARLADRAGDPAAAKRWLGEVLENGRDEIVREPAHQMLCRLLVREAAATATECLRQLRREHPSSSRDAETLATLAQRERAEGGCQAALPLYAEYLRRYPHGPFAREATEAVSTCQQPAAP